MIEKIISERIYHNSVKAIVTTVVCPNNEPIWIPDSIK